MSDIVERLELEGGALLSEGAAEIVLLRMEIILLEAAGAEAADEIERLRVALLEARREGFLAALVMAERRCMDAATYVRTRARTNEEHSIANTYEQAGTMVRAVPVPDNLREVTGLEYRGG
jgi:hypothetical protein